jgi:hypothetical protein
VGILSSAQSHRGRVSLDHKNLASQFSAEREREIGREGERERGEGKRGERRRAGGAGAGILGTRECSGQGVLRRFQDGE